MIIKFDVHGNRKQLDAARLWADDVTTEIVYGGSKGSGKSYLGVSMIFGDALMYPNTHYFISRKRLNDLRKYTLPSIYEVFEHWGITQEYYNYNATDSYFELYNGSKVYLIQARYEPQDPDYYRFGSMQMTRGWVEEAGEIPLLAKNALLATVGRWNNEKYGPDGSLLWSLTPKVLQTCNPAKNYLYHDFYKKHKEGTLECWRAFIQALPRDNKRLPKGYLENLERSLTENQKQRLLYGNWEFDDDPDVLVDWDAITDSFTNDHIHTGDSHPALSLDIATRGRDKFIGAQFNGLIPTLSFGGVTARFVLDIDKTQSKEIEAAVRQVMREKRVPRSRVVADSDGLGDFLASYLKGIKEFHGNSRPFNPILYKNLKSQCAYKLAELINNRQIHIICTPEQQERIMDELGCLKGVNTTDPSAKKETISKDEMKELNGGKSPDYLDALIMGCMFLVMKAPARGGHTTGYGKASDFNKRTV